MTNRQSNRALMASGLSLVLCLAMLIGTTFAWFSDSVSNKGNRIQAGKLAVGFTASDTLENNDLGTTGLGDLADESIKLFDLANWAPGDTYTRYMRVKNLGSLALKYNINFVLSGDNSLADAIKLDVSPAINAPTVVNGSNVSAATAENIKMNGVLAKADDFQIFKVDLSFLESAGNTYQGGSFGLDVNLVATQNNANANIITAKDASAFANAPANSTIVLQKDITTAETIAITEFVNIDLNGYTLTCKDFSIVKDDAIGTIDVANGKIVADNIKISAEKGSVNVTKLNGTVSANGTVYLNGSMNTVNISGESSFNVPVTVSANTKVVIADDVLTPVSFKVTGENVRIENNGVVGTVDATEAGEKVVISGNAPGSTIGNIDATEATGWDGVTLTSVTPENNVYKINTASELAWIANQVNSKINNFSKTTIQLTENINLNNKEWIPIGRDKSTAFKGAFDGNGKTISNLSIDGNLDDIPANENLGLFGYAQSAEIKNFTINNAYVSGYFAVGAVAGMPFSGVQFSDINVTGRVVIKANEDAGAIFGYGYSKMKNCHVNVTKDSEVNGGGFIGGLIGFSGEGTGVVISDCSSNISIVGRFNGLGGLIGALHYGNTVENSSCSAVVTQLDDCAPYVTNNVGGIAGAYLASGSTYATIKHCSFTGTLMDGEIPHSNGNALAGGPFSGTQAGNINIIS